MDDDIDPIECPQGNQAESADGETAPAAGGVGVKV